MHGRGPSYKTPSAQKQKRLKLEYEDDGPILVGRKGSIYSPIYRTKPASARVDSLPRQTQTEHCDFSRKSKGEVLFLNYPAHRLLCLR